MRGGVQWLSQGDAACFGIIDDRAQRLIQFMGQPGGQVPHRVDAIGMRKLRGENLIARFACFSFDDLVAQGGQHFVELSRALRDLSLEVIDLAAHRTGRGMDDEPS